MAARCGTSGTLLAGALSLLLLHSAPLVAGGVCVKTACSKTPYPDYCTTVLSAIPESKTVADARALAELAIHASNKIGAAAGNYARSQLGVVKDSLLWQCLHECAEDIEDALDHIDDSEGGGIDDLKFGAVGSYLAAAETDSWSCDESCRDTSPSAVKTTVLTKNTEFEKMMSITNALIKQATAAAPSPAPTKKR